VAVVTSLETPYVLFDVMEDVATITLNRPEKRNALSRGLLRELEAILDGIPAEPRIRVVIVASKGTVFCSGHDLSEMIGCSEEGYRDLFAHCSRVMMRLRRLPQPVIARVQGVATAAGCQLVAACDLAVAADNATFATPGVKIGLFCTTPMVPLVRAIPAKPALEMLLTGEAISAERALELGLVNRVVPAEKLDETVQLFVDLIRRSSPAIIQLGKAAFYDQKNLDEATAYDRATQVMVDNAMLPDSQEGIQAFLQKRTPKWSCDQ
jgi:enoyl-CoA hydratase/carnithine racemase